jgi:hypothetical protein
MAKTNFSGPITTGPIQVNTGTTVGTNVRDAAFVKNSMCFPFDFNSIAVTTDANKLAITSSNPSSTTSVTLVDATQNVPGITSVGGFEMASAITITSSSSDSGTDAVITGTDILGNAQTETLALGTLATSVKAWKTVTSIELDAGSAGTLEVGVLATALVSVLARSLFNENPLAETSGGNLANNIVIPPFSRVTDIRLNNSVAYSQITTLRVGANVAQAAGATLNSIELDYFAGDTSVDVKAIASHHVPVLLAQSAAQQDSCMNVSDGDASGYEIDKAVIITMTHASGIATTGNSYLTMDWMQKINATN